MKKLYVLVRSDLSKSQQAVQSAHAVAQYLVENPSSEWRNSTIVLLKTETLATYLPFAHSHFREPDIGNEITAMAHYGKGDKFEDLRLI